MKLRTNIKDRREAPGEGCRSTSGFTMIEIAISLAIIGIALVAIVGVLPIGMHTQQDNREETIINQDATIIMEDIRNGAKGADDLTNYVYAITNYWTFYNGNTTNSGVNGYTYSSAPTTLPGYWTTSGGGLSTPINSGTNIIGLLSTPEYQNGFGTPIANLNNGGYSNHVVAYVYSMSGPAVEKPPQDNNLLQSTFTYRLICETVPVPLNLPASTPSTAAALNSSLQNNLYQLRLFFRWPQQPSGSLGPGAQSFRTMIAGQMVPDGLQTNLLFFQSQSFTNTLAGGVP